MVGQSFKWPQPWSWASHSFDAQQQEEALLGPRASKKPWTCTISKSISRWDTKLAIRNKVYKLFLRSQRCMESDILLTGKMLFTNLPGSSSFFYPNHLIFLIKVRHHFFVFWLEPIKFCWIKVCHHRMLLLLPMYNLFTLTIVNNSISC